MAQNNLPSAPIKNKTLTKFGHERLDPYYWMNERDSKGVLDYIDQENKYCEAHFSGLEPLVDTLLEELEGRIDPNEQKSPFWYKTLPIKKRGRHGI